MGHGEHYCVEDPPGASYEAPALRDDDIDSIILVDVPREGPVLLLDEPDDDGVRLDGRDIHGAMVEGRQDFKPPARPDDEDSWAFLEPIGKGGWKGLSEGEGGGVPVGVDQVPHLEITREIARRFNYLYGDVFPEPAALLTEVPKIPGTDGRKMGKSYNNAVFLSDSPKEIDAKLSRMTTDTRRVRRTDPGEPDDCPAFNLHLIFCTADELDYVRNGCRTAGIGCLECKKIMIKPLIAEIEPVRERRAELERQPDAVVGVLEGGNARARAVAEETMAEVREAMKL